MTDPDLGGAKTYGSYGSGSGSTTLLRKYEFVGKYRKK
jgi:hypothetical protein